MNTKAPPERRFDGPFHCAALLHRPKGTGVRSHFHLRCRTRSRGGAGRVHRRGLSAPRRRVGPDARRAVSAAGGWAGQVLGACMPATQCPLSPAPGHMPTGLPHESLLVHQLKGPHTGPLVRAVAGAQTSWPRNPVGPSQCTCGKRVGRACSARAADCSGGAAWRCGVVRAGQRALCSPAASE